MSGNHLLVFASTSLKLCAVFQDQTQRKLLQSNSVQTSCELHFPKPGVFKRITSAPQRVEGEHTVLFQSVRRGEGVDARIRSFYI